MKSKNIHRKLGYALLSLIVLTGVYNAVVINSHSSLSSSDSKFVKRLDEVYGITLPGRSLATEWRKLPSVNTITQPMENGLQPIAASVEVIPAPAVDEELNLHLVEVINPMKWEKGLKTEQFNGSLITNSGVIENLNVSLPGHEQLSISFTEMNGNIFEYDLNGEIFSGLMYQVDQFGYMVTLTNGPLEGTRLRFSTQDSFNEQAQPQDLLADKNIEIGTFGASAEKSSDPFSQIDQEIQGDAANAQGFNFNQAQSI